MKNLMPLFDNMFYASDKRRLRMGRGLPVRITSLMLCSALVSPGIALAKNTVQSDAGCAVLSSTIYTGNPFTAKIVRVPSYTGGWSWPTVDVKAVFTKTDGGTITKTSSETISRYGVTYVNVTMSAPSCNGDPCEIDFLSEPAVITAVVSEPINKGSRTRETTCTPAVVPVNQSM